MLGRLSPLLLVATATAEFAAPAFAWNIKGVKGDQHHGPVSGSDVERLISSSQREVNVVFLADSLTTEDVKEYGAKLPALQGFLRDLPSLTLPFTTAHDVRLFEHTVARISAAAAEEYFKSNAHLFSNGKPDVVVVELANRSVLPSRSSSPSTTPRSRASARSCTRELRATTRLSSLPAAMPTAGFSSRRAPTRARICTPLPRF